VSQRLQAGVGLDTSLECEEQRSLVWLSKNSGQQPKSQSEASHSLENFSLMKFKFLDLLWCKADVCNFRPNKHRTFPNGPMRLFFWEPNMNVIGMFHVDSF